MNGYKHALVLLAIACPCRCAAARACGGRSQTRIYADKKVATQRGIRTVPVPVRWEQYFSNLCNLTFIQIGANCGTDECAIGGEPIWQYQRDFNWRGTVIEMNPFEFRRLVSNYRPYPLVTPMNLAITDHNGSHVDMWCNVDPLKAPSEVCTLTQHWAKRAGFKHHMAIKSMSLSELWQELRLERVDVFVIDAEGGEFHILGQPLPSPLPTFVLYEMSGFSKQVQPGGPAMLALLRRRIAAQGYEPIFLGNFTPRSSTTCCAQDDLWRLVDPKLRAALNGSEA